MLLHWVLGTTSNLSLRKHFEIQLSTHTKSTTWNDVYQTMNLRRQVGEAGSNEALLISCTHVATASPISSKPELQVYEAVSPIELPLNVTTPLSGSVGLRHKAKNEVSAGN